MVKDDNNRTSQTLINYINDESKILDDKYKNIKIKGNEISTMYYIADQKYKNIVDQIYKSCSRPKIQLKEQSMIGGVGNNLSNIVDSRNKRNIFPNQNNIVYGIPVPIIQLLKGQYCEYDANSAFNYHWKYTSRFNDNKIIRSPIPVQEENTTGLFEYILDALEQHQNKNQNTITKININVCGNVGNVCVIQTILQGIVMFNKIYKNRFNNIKVEFNFYMAGTRFAPVETLGNFESKPAPNSVFLEKLQNYTNELKISSFIDEYIFFVNTNFTVYDYELQKLGVILF